MARLVAKAGIVGLVSLAGRVAKPKDLSLPQRVGGFGGVEGLRDYLRAERISHVVDATHPFAAQISHNAVAACAAEDVPLLALTRAQWAPHDGDNWRHVSDIDGAVDALAGRPQRVMLAVGRMHLEVFAAQPQHRYLLRLVDPPDALLPLPKADCVVARGPFALEDDLELMRRYAIECVVSKNSGGTGAYAKIEAARHLGLPVIMIDRPRLPDRQEVTHERDVLAWLGHAGTDLGV